MPDHGHISTYAIAVIIIKWCYPFHICYRLLFSLCRIKCHGMCQKVFCRSNLHFNLQRQSHDQIRQIQHIHFNKPLFHQIKRIISVWPYDLPLLFRRSIIKVYVISKSLVMVAPYPRYVGLQSAGSEIHANWVRRSLAAVKQVAKQIDVILYGRR